MLFFTCIRLVVHLLICARATARIEWIRLLWSWHSPSTNVISSASSYFILKARRLCWGWSSGEVVSQCERKVLPCFVVESIGVKCQNGILPPTWPYFTNLRQMQTIQFCDGGLTSISLVFHSKPSCLKILRPAKHPAMLQFQCSTSLPHSTKLLSLNKVIILCQNHL